MDPVSYDKFYKEGGWSSRPWEWRVELMEKNVFPYIGKHKEVPGSELDFQGNDPSILPLDTRKKRILDIGCGMGQDASLLAEAGHDVTGIDSSPVGIKYAKRQYPNVKFICNDLAKQKFKKKFDVIFSRGMSWYHYELLGVNSNGIDVPKETKRLFTFLKKGGIFILAIATDFTGTKRSSDRTPDSIFINNKLDDYIKLFSQFGEIIYVANWEGKKLKTQADTKGSGGIYIITRK